MKKRMQVTVTKKDALAAREAQRHQHDLNSTYNASRGCALAVAVRRRFPAAAVGYRSVKLDAVIWSATDPDACHKFTRDFDRDKPVMVPATFTFVRY